MAKASTSTNTGTGDLDKFLAQQDIPGAVAMGINATGIFYEGAFGVANTATGTPLTLDTPFAIMSMTKPVTSFAIMMLIEQGKLKLDDAAANYLPHFSNLMVLSDIDIETKKFSHIAQKSDFTIRQLLNHTAGFGYSFCNHTLSALTPASNADDFGLLHQPGTQWTYGISTAVLGDIICAITGKSLIDAFKEMIFDPLGMTQTDFDLKDNMSHVHVKTDGKWNSMAPMAIPPRGDGGLKSTAPDYAQFLQCLLNNGAPLLSSEAFQEMIRNQLGDLFIAEQPAANPSFTFPFPRGGGQDKFGLGFQIHLATRPGMRSSGSYSWCGLLNTYFWGDPVKRIGGILLMQVLPLFHPDCLDTLDGFEKRLYQLTS